MLEQNIRSASIVGYVGAGGVGVLLHVYQEYYQWDRFATVLVFILALVTLLDVAGEWVRRQVAPRIRVMPLAPKAWLRRSRLKHTGTSTCVATVLPSRRAGRKIPRCIRPARSVIQ